MVWNLIIHTSIVPIRISLVGAAATYIFNIWIVTCVTSNFGECPYHQKWIDTRYSQKTVCEGILSSADRVLICISNLQFWFGSRVYQSFINVHSKDKGLCEINGFPQIYSKIEEFDEPTPCMMCCYFLLNSVHYLCVHGHFNSLNESINMVLWN